MHAVGQDRSGQDVTCIDLNYGGMSARILTSGAILQDLRLTEDGRPLVLGYPSFEPYLSDKTYMGTTVGRCANRIKDGVAVIDGQRFQLDQNENGKTHLHGGWDGSARRNWRLIDCAQSRVVLEDTLPDGHMGYPGALTVQVRFELMRDQIFEVEISATTDAPTLCNFAHHSYFNFGPDTTIEGHRLSVTADSYLESDQDGLPTGRIMTVEDTQFDLRHGKTLTASDAYDHNMCLSNVRRPISKVARLVGPDGMIAMDISTTEPGLQVYTGQSIAAGPDIGHHGQVYGAYAGLALEPQGWPDAVNKAGFPSTLLLPDQTYHQVTRFQFTRQQSSLR